MTQLALFDLDHTLLPVDSDHEWGRFLVKIGVVDSDHYAAKMNVSTLTTKPVALILLWFSCFCAKTTIGAQ